MSMSWLIQPELHVNNLAVAPSARRQGLGRALMLATLELARLAGAEDCLLEVQVGNQPAESLYAQLGFVRTGLRRAYYCDGGDAALLTLKGLGAPLAGGW
jgi:ribosomal-protein-alanine N-acetyltransferase